MTCRLESVEKERGDRGVETASDVLGTDREGGVGGDLKLKDAGMRTWH